MKPGGGGRGEGGTTCSKVVRVERVRASLLCVSVCTSARLERCKRRERARTSPGNLVDRSGFFPPPCAPSPRPSENDALVCSVLPRPRRTRPRGSRRPRDARRGWSASSPRSSRTVAIDSSHSPAPVPAAVHVRELIAYRAYNTGTLMSVFPDDAPVPVPGLPFGLVSSPSHSSGSVCTELTPSDTAARVLCALPRLERRPPPSRHAHRSGPSPRSSPRYSRHDPLGAFCTD